MASLFRFYASAVKSDLTWRSNSMRKDANMFSVGMHCGEFIFFFIEKLSQLKIELHIKSVFFLFQLETQGKKSVQSMES